MIVVVAFSASKDSQKIVSTSRDLDRENMPQSSQRLLKLHGDMRRQHSPHPYTVASPSSEPTS